MIVQFGDHFVRQPRHLTVIQHFWQQRIFVALLFFDLILLTRDVTFVFDLNFNLLSRFSIVEAWCKWCHLNQLFVSHAGTT
ncbi:hypothetical protein D3C78_1661530 [compost metagenome]